MAYQNNGRKNNNNRRFKNGKNNRRGRKFSSYDDENISPQQRRQFANKADNFTTKAKEAQRSDRVEAENLLQHAEHYYRMSQLGLDKLPKREETENDEEIQTDDEKSENNLNGNKTEDKVKKIVEDMAESPKEEVPGESIADLPFMQN